MPVCSFVTLYFKSNPPMVSLVIGAGVTFFAYGLDSAREYMVMGGGWQDVCGEGRHLAAA